MSDSSVRGLAAGSEGFRAGLVLGKSVAIYERSFGKYLVFGAVIALPDLLSGLGHRAQMRNVEVFAKGIDYGARISDASYTLLGILLLALCELAMTHGVLRDMRGHVGTSVGKGIGRALPVFAASLSATLLTWIGAILLILPGLIILSALFVVVPVCAIEGLGPIRSLGRSCELTRGHRWPIFGIFLVPLLVLGAASALFQGIGLNLGGTTGSAIAGYLVSAVIGPYRAIANIVTYQELRAVKEGPDIEHLAAVFD
jgi:hypothetical protein